MTAPISYTVTDIARVCYEANRALQNVLGDSHPSEPWDAVDGDTRQGYKQAVLQVAIEQVFDRALQHARWCAHMRARGWRYGEVKDEVEKTHPLLVDDYSKLPAREQDKDGLFLAIVRVLTARDHSLEPVPPRTPACPA